MARNVHWRIQFRTRSEKIGVLNLYEENYSGAVVELTPAAVPFETQEDSSDKWLEPIRKQSGYIRLIDEGNIEGIMPVGLKDRYVEYKEDGVLKWCGYMVPDVFSSDWDVTPLEVEFPVVGGLGVLEGVYLNENDGLGVVPLARLVYDALKATGVDYSMIYFPKEVLQSESATDYLYPMRLEVSRFNFFQDNDSLNSEDSDWTRYNGETHYNVLSEVMRFYGWTIRERGEDIWITSTNNEGSVKISMTDLSVLAEGFAMAENESVSVEEYDLSSFGLAGADHKRDILQGRKKVIVKASVNPVGTVIPSIDKSKMKLIGNVVQEWSDYRREKRKLYIPKEGYTDVQLNSYAIATPDEVFSSWHPIEQNMISVSLYVGAYFMEQEYVTDEEYQKKKNWNLTETIKINLQDFGGRYPSLSEAKNLPILVMRSRNIANYTSGAFVISSQTRSREWETQSWSTEGNGKGTLEIKLRVGGKYWNGSTWITSPAWFEVQMGNEEDPGSTEGTGKIISTKTIDMPYNGADGYVIPINETVSGEVELTIHAVRNDGGYAVLMLDNFKVEYWGEDSDETNSDDSENRYAKKTRLNYTNEEEIRLKIATNNNNKAGYGILSQSGTNVESLYFIEKGMMRPEMNLVNKGISLYGRSTEKLTLQLDKISARPHDVIMWKGKKYLLASEAVNWAEETGEYIIMEV